MTDRRLNMIALGGTIASVPSDGEGTAAAPRLTSDELLGAIPVGSIDAEIDVHQHTQCASGDLTVRDILNLADYIRTRAERYNGFVITQGTDTLEETSYLLDLTLPPEIPVILTGAMRNPGLPGADGPANLTAAVQTALADGVGGMGPLVVFADEIHAARYVQKGHTASVAAFTSPNAGPIGWVVEDRVRLNLQPRRHTATYDPGQVGRIPDVAIVRLALGSTPGSLRGLDQFDGVVVEVYGGGHAPSELVPSLADLGQEIPVVMASRTGAGELYRSTYGFPGSETDLLDRGLISANSLDSLKARLLLMMALAAEEDRSQIAATFAAAV